MLWLSLRKARLVHQVLCARFHDVAELGYYEEPTSKGYAEPTWRGIQNRASALRDHIVVPRGVSHLTEHKARIAETLQVKRCQLGRNDEEAHLGHNCFRGSVRVLQ